MIFKIFTQFLIGLSLFVASTANAVLIPMDDWFDPTGSYTDGLTVSSFNTTLFYAIANDITYDPVNTYVVPDGWHIATFEEWVDSYYLGHAQNDTSQSIHCDLNGWAGCTTLSEIPDSKYFL
ncbi:MAG: hypothetical protein QF552_11465, partial [Litorilituus sp.]|nr:hypothetical protein [Litorilituus sp.]